MTMMTRRVLLLMLLSSIYSSCLRLYSSPYVLVIAFSAPPPIHNLLLLRSKKKVTAATTTTTGRRRTTRRTITTKSLSSSSLFGVTTIEEFHIDVVSPTTTADGTSTTTKTSIVEEEEEKKRAAVVEFSKYHGLGNDFILIDNRHVTEPSLSSKDAIQLCDRHFGIGGDGVIFALKPTETETDDEYDYAMRIYNSDGTEPEMCGNGIRCMARFLRDLEQKEGRVQDKKKSKNSYRIQTLAGPIIPVLNDDNDEDDDDGSSITVDMGEPILQPLDVPTTLKSSSSSSSDSDPAVVEQDYVDRNGKSWKISCVSMGNPHAIIFVNDLEKDIQFEVDGPILESDTTAFPAKTNVEFVQVLQSGGGGGGKTNEDNDNDNNNNEQHLLMKVWERGAGPTLACGTGACALVVAAILANKVQSREQMTRVTLPGGDLYIQWNTVDNKVYMTGPATFAFSGTAIL